MKMKCPFCKTSDEHSFVPVQFGCEDREGIPSAIACDSCGCRSPMIYVTKKEWENSNGEIPPSLINHWNSFFKLTCPPATSNINTVMNDMNTTGEDFEKEEREMQYGGWEGCWPGDGSGLSDFDDYNQNEGGDY